MKKKIAIALAAAVSFSAGGVFNTAACAPNNEKELVTAYDQAAEAREAAKDKDSTTEIQTAKTAAEQADIEAEKEAVLQLDMTKWQYDREADVFWQAGIPYCQNPVDAELQTMTIFVPAGYMTGVRNGVAGDTFTCTVNKWGRINRYMTAMAPVIMPVNTPGYMRQQPAAGLNDEYRQLTKEGFIVAVAGCRGREDGAPSGVVDLKAAIRCLRSNTTNLPGNMNRIFAYGMSGGGAQTAVLASSGNSSLYEPYLTAIGAAEAKDDILGAMCWCPVTSLESADAAYEWNMGMTRTNTSPEMSEISRGLAANYAAYLNNIKLKSFSGKSLSLKPSAKGVYQEGSYYEYLKSVIEESLNDFLCDTAFPFTVKEADDLPFDKIGRQPAAGAVKLTGTYQTQQDYIDALNQPFNWVKYDAQTNLAQISSVADFAKAVKPAAKDIGAFDALNLKQGENMLFGYGDGQGVHFDQMLAADAQGTSYEAAFKDMFSRTDAQGNNVRDRLNMYSPLYYLLPANAGYHKSTVAKYWRIRSGIFQTDTALCTELNLALAAKNYDKKNTVDFETLWQRQHIKAEETTMGEEQAIPHFIKWVNECLLK